MNQIATQPATAAPNKEAVYDAEISPLMAQIIAICQRAGISMLASFAIPTADNPDLQCTTLLPDETGKQTPTIKAAYRGLIGEPTVIAFTVTKNG